MRRMGRNPARIIPEWRSFVEAVGDRAGARYRRARLARPEPDELQEC